MEGSSSLDKMVLKKSNKNHYKNNYDRMLGPSDCSTWLGLRWAFTGTQHEQLLVRRIAPWSRLWAGSREIQPSSNMGIQETLSSCVLQAVRTPDSLPAHR